MRLIKCILLFLVVSFFTITGILYAEEVKEIKPPDAKPQEKVEEAKVTGSGSLGAYNQYIFRGYEIGKSGLVVQPSLTASFKGFSATIWGNMDTNQRNTKTASFYPNEPAGTDHQFKKGWNETDLTLSYTYAIKKLSLTGGFIYYGTRYADETEELFASATYDILTKPTLAVYRDITNYKGTYFNLSFSHSLPVYKETTLDLGASFGYFIGESDYWKTYDQSTATYTGSKYKGFHDGMVKAGLTIPVTKAFSIQPVVQYWFPLSSDAKKEYATAGDIKNSYNPNGPVKNNFIYGIGFTYSF
ncbi:MAG: hypothetical protein NT178_11625 [Proteobacteria bacterium]|nr:hypothetical protein [Pseudomonadota bacterium]